MLDFLWGLLEMLSLSGGKKDRDDARVLILSLVLIILVLCLLFYLAV